ncbi:MAG: hypothetical protein BZY87_05210 [SAR202 cluster bacterium Io17-Chloro-G6]|nr:MAG: hypothetical protein BZY87_05210 [SAR202 cluster bacterium Io17-Chloro-G6]
MTTPSETPESAIENDPWSQGAVTSAETTLQAQMGKVFGYLKGLHATHLIDVGTKLGLFGQLANAPTGLTPEALATTEGLDLKYIRQWCETGCALELLDYEPTSGYRLAPFMDEILGRPDGTFYLGSFPEVHLLVARDYTRYPELFNSGDVYSYQEHDEPFLRGVAEALQTIPRMFLGTVLPNLPELRERLEAGISILDVGCGGGYAIVEFAERYPEVRCVGIDVESTSVRMAQELIRSRGLGERVEARELDGAGLPPDFVDSFDLVTTFLVLHEIHPDLKEAVLDQCVRALRPGGQLLLFDERYPSGPAELRDPSQIYAVMAQWYELTWGNIINTKEEIHALLARQGLRVVAETTFSRFYIVVAEKDPSKPA